MSSVTRLRDRFEIHFDQPLPALAPRDTLAFAARDLRSPAIPLLAVIPKMTRSIRVQVATIIRSNRMAALATPLDWGVIDCAPLSRRSWVVIGDFPDGGRLISDHEESFPPWREEEIVNRILRQIVPALKMLHQQGAAHRNVRLDNIYFRDQHRRLAMLGDAVSMPPAVNQPALYETIENAMCSPQGRGDGRPTDDLYALGILVVHLLTGSPPGEGNEEPDLLERKIAHGSHVALVRDLGCSPALNELLRGLLADMAVDRWSYPELETWLDGRRVPLKIPTGFPVATRPLTIADIPCFTPRSAASALTSLGESAGEIVHGRSFQTWLTRALSAPKIAENVAVTLKDGDDADAATRGLRIVTRVAIALDPTAPIRYGPAAVLPEGIGTALATAFLGTENNREIKTLADIVQSRMVQTWCRFQTTLDAVQELLTRDYDRLRGFVADRRPGYGIERVLYELNPRLHCLSPSIEAAVVTTLEGILPALEDAAATGKIQTLPIDRHVAAFIAARSRQITDRIWGQLGQTSIEDRLLANVAILAWLQADHGPSRLSALGGLIGPQTGAALNSYHSRTTQRHLKNAAEEAATAGRFTTLLQILDDTASRQKDRDQYAQARQRYHEALQGVRRCLRDTEALPQIAEKTGHGTAAMLAGLVSGVVIIFAVLSAFLG